MSRSTRDEPDGSPLVGGPTESDPIDDDTADDTDDDTADRSGLFIDGAFVESIDGASLRSVNPATGEFLAEISEAGAADIDRAVAAARAAFRPWSKAAARDRGQALYRLANLVAERTRELALLETLDTGRPIRQTRDAELPLAVAHLAYYADVACHREILGSVGSARGRGVSAHVLPWTAPLLTLTRQVAPALAAGCTVVIKPAAPASLTALALADLCAEAEIPPGVVNIVTGDSDTGTLLVRHPDVDVVGFTGPARIGTALQRAVAGTPKKVSAVVQAPAVAVVRPGADVARAAAAIVQGLVHSPDPAGWNGVRALVHESIRDELRWYLNEQLCDVRMGDPLDSATDLGPVATPERLRALAELVGSSSDAWSAPTPLPEQGWWLPASTLTATSYEEYLGPVIAIETYASAAESAHADWPGLRVGVWPGGRAAERAHVVWQEALNLMDPAAPTGRQGGPRALVPYLRSEVA